MLAITALLIAATAAPALALLPNGQSAPNFQLTDLSGTSHTLSEYRGKVVVIDFFGYACSACQNDAKNTLVPLYNSYFKNDPNVQFLGVEIANGSVSQDQAFAQETGASWPILSGGSSVGSAYQVVSTPTVYVISPAGTVASSSVYPTNAATLRSTIDSLESRAPAACAPSSNSLALFAQGYGRRPLVEVLEWRDLVGIDVPRRDSDLVTRGDVTESCGDHRLCARQRRRHLVQGLRGRLLGCLDLHRRGGCCQHRTSGMLMGRRSSRRFCTRHERRHVP